MNSFMFDRQKNTQFILDYCIQKQREVKEIVQDDDGALEYYNATLSQKFSACVHSYEQQIKAQEAEQKAAEEEQRQFDEAQKRRDAEERRQREEERQRNEERRQREREQKENKQAIVETQKLVDALEELNRGHSGSSPTSSDGLGKVVEGTHVPPFIAPLVRQIERNVEILRARLKK